MTFRSRSKKIAPLINVVRRLPQLLLATAWAIASLMTLLPATAHAASSHTLASTHQLFVSEQGQDSNTGTSASDPVRQIQTAIDRAGSGSTIFVQAGSYEPIKFDSKSGISIEGSAGATITDGAYDRIAAVSIRDSDAIQVDGVGLTKALWGIHVERSSNLSLSNLEIYDVGQEGVHIREYSSDVSIVGCTISLTGQRGGVYANYGEGIYLGTGQGITDDDTNNIRIVDNNISRTTSEAIDVKPSVYNVLIERNQIHDIDTNTSGAVVVGIGTRSYRHPQVTIRGNLIWNISTNTQWTDGNAITLSGAATVEANVIWSTQHHGVLMDNNFVSADKDVNLNNNAIYLNGNSPIGIWDSNAANSAQPTYLNNIDDGEVASLLGSLPTTSGSSAPASLVGLRDSLVSSLGADQSPIATTIPEQPAPSPDVATTSTTLEAESASPSSSVPDSGQTSTTQAASSSPPSTSGDVPAGDNPSGADTGESVDESIDELRNASTPANLGPSGVSDSSDVVEAPGISSSDSNPGIPTGRQTSPPTSATSDSSIDSLDQPAPDQLALIDIRSTSSDGNFPIRTRHVAALGAVACGAGIALRKWKPLHD